MALHYRHHVPGRLRVRTPHVKQRAATAVAAERWLSSVPGVRRAEANVLTGSVTISYDPATTSGEVLLRLLLAHGYIDNCDVPSATPPIVSDAVSAATTRLITAVTLRVAEKAVERTLATLLAAAL